MNLDLTNIDFDDPQIERVCQSGYNLGSYPYYCAFQIRDIIKVNE